MSKRDIKFQNDIHTIAQRYGEAHDTQLRAFANDIANSILTYTENYGLNRINSIRFERGFEIAYLKSAPPSSQP